MSKSPAYLKAYPKHESVSLSLAPKPCRHPKDGVYVLGLSVRWCPSCGAVRWAHKEPGKLGRWRRPSGGAK